MLRRFNRLSLTEKLMVVFIFAEIITFMYIALVFSVCMLLFWLVLVYLVPSKSRFATLFFKTPRLALLPDRWMKPRFRRHLESAWPNSYSATRGRSKPWGPRSSEWTICSASLVAGTDTEAAVIKAISVADRSGITGPASTVKSTGTMSFGSTVTPRPARTAA